MSSQNVFEVSKQKFQHCVATIAITEYQSLLKSCVAVMITLK